ncbi:cytosine deaminase protein-like protein [Cryomyces antarcticus]
MAAAFLAGHGINLDEEMSKIQFAGDGRRPEAHLGQPTLSKISGVRLPHKPSNTLWDISISQGCISAIEPHHASHASTSQLPGVLDATARLLASSLCHAHIHLDKCFLLQDPNYGDLQTTEGSFEEAMSLTSTAKGRFTEEDLLRRGRQLVEESIAFGVTHMRAFAEIDEVVGCACLDASLQLKDEFAGRCDIQVCAFAQLALFSEGCETNHSLMERASTMAGVDVLGSTPYVESDPDKMKKNIETVTRLALRYKKHLDFHLDYSLDREKEPMVWHVLNCLKETQWLKNAEGRRVTLGHCTRLSLFTPEEWRKLKREIGDLPVSFVGLPTSDLFMMRTKTRARGTLRVPELIKDYGIRAAVGVNNVGNWFTPQGSCDPLSVASLGVAVYQDGTQEGADLLYECVSSRAKDAVGFENTTLDLNIGEPADFVIFGREQVEWRTRRSVMNIVYDAGHSRRQTVKRGMLVY